MKNGSKLFLLLFALCLLGACKKREVPGPQGPTGDAGKGGSANSASSGIFLIAGSEWTSPDQIIWQVLRNSSFITKNLADKGSIKTLMEINNVWWELPYVEHDLFMQCSFKEGVAHLTFEEVHRNLPPQPTTRNYR